MKRQTKLGAQEQQQQISHSAPASALEFQSAEEMLRYDAAQTPVPPEICERLGASVKQRAVPPSPWWRKWLRR